MLIQRAEAEFSTQDLAGLRLEIQGPKGETLKFPQRPLVKDRMAQMEPGGLVVKDQRPKGSRASRDPGAQEDCGRTHWRRVFDRLWGQDHRIS